MAKSKEKRELSINKEEAVALFSKFQEFFKGAENDFNSYISNSNRSAGLRFRKALIEIKKLTTPLRKICIEHSEE